MPSNSDVNATTGGQSRVFIQVGGASPANQYQYIGHLNLGDSEQDLGASDKIEVPSSERADKWEIIDRVPKSQALGSHDFNQLIDRFMRDWWVDLKERNCLFNVQVKRGRCNRPDSINDWESKELYLYNRLTSITIPGANPLKGDDNSEAMASGSMEFQRFVPIRRLTLDEKGDSTILAEILDAFWQDPSTMPCDDCSEFGQGIYALALMNGGSPGLSGQIVRSVDGGTTWTSIDVAALGATSPNRFAAAGQYIVIAAQAKLGHIYTTFADVDAGTSNTTLVTSGYVASKGPRAIVSKNPALTIAVGAGGYIYLISNPVDAATVLSAGSQTTQALNDVHYSGSTFVAVGDSNAVVYSDNNGDSWAAVTGPSVGGNLTGVWCLSDRIWFVTVGSATGAGQLWYTLNKGVSWTQKLLPGQATITTLVDIRFSKDGQLGYISAQRGASAIVFTTTDGGNTWELAGSSAMRLRGVPTAERINCVVPCEGNVNLLVLAGRKTAAGDGIISIAS